MRRCPCFRLRFAFALSPRSLLNLSRFQGSDRSGPPLPCAASRQGRHLIPTDFQEDVPQIAMRWSKVLRTGSVEAKFMAVDLSTIMFTMERGQDLEQLKEFVLSHPEAYEMKIGDQVYRRPGDPPLDEVFKTLQREKSDVDGHDPAEDLQISRDEL